MDLMSILEGVVATVFCSVSGTFIRWLIKKSRESKQEPPEKRHAPKRLVRRQFFASLFVLMASFAVLFSVRGSGVFFLFARYAAGMTALVSYLLAWGAFDAAYTFYPPADEPDENTSNGKTDTKADDPVDVR